MSHESDTGTPDGSSTTDPSKTEAEELLGELWLRITAGGDGDGDGDAVLDETALALADRLVHVSTTPSGEMPVEVVHAITVLRAIRFMSGADDDERLIAIRLLTELRGTAPELASEELFALLGAGVDDGLALLGADLLHRARTTADRHLLDQAVDTLHEAVRATSDNNTDLAGRLSNLGLAYRLRSERYGTDDDLDRAVAAGAASVSVVSDGAFETTGCLANFADSLHTRFEHDGDVQDLEEAITTYRAAVAAAQEGHPLQAVVLGKLGAALTSGFAVFDGVEDIDTAVELCDHAATTVTVDDPFYAQCQTNLGSALAMRATWTNARGDIEGAVTACRNALDATVPGEPAASTRWLNLSAALHDRYELLGARDDLDGAVAAARSALAAAVATADSLTFLAMLFANASNILRIRGDLDDDRTDLESAVDTARRAVALSPDGHTARANRLNNLGTALLSWFDHNHRRDHSTGSGNLSEGIAALIEATGSTARNSNRAGSLNTLGLLLLKRFEHDGTVADLTAAIRAATAAVAAYPTEHPSLAGAALNLGSAYKAAFECRHRDTDLTAAIGSWRSGTTAVGSPAALRLACARQWAEFAAAEGLWDLSAEGYGHAVALLPIVSWRGLGRLDQEYGLTRQAPVTSDAAAARLVTMDPAGAIEHLELGRGVLWAQQLDMRDGLEPLRVQLPELADSLDRVRRALDNVNFVATSALRRT